MQDKIYCILSVPGGPAWVRKMGIEARHLKHLLTRGLVLMNTGIQPWEYVEPDDMEKFQIPIVAEMQYYKESRDKWDETYAKLKSSIMTDLVIIYIVGDGDVRLMDESLNSDHPAFSYGRTVQFIEDFKDRYPLFTKYLVTHPWPAARSGIPEDEIIKPDIAGWSIANMKKYISLLDIVKREGQSFCGYWTTPELVEQNAMMLREQAEWLRDQGAAFALVQTGLTGFHELVQEGVPLDQTLTPKAHAIRMGLGWPK